MKTNERWRGGVDPTSKDGSPQGPGSLGTWRIKFQALEVIWVISEVIWVILEVFWVILEVKTLETLQKPRPDPLTTCKIRRFSMHFRLVF